MIDLTNRSQVRKLVVAAALVCCSEPSLLFGRMSEALSDDPVSIQKINAALNALGGYDAIAKVMSVAVTGTSVRPDDPTTRSVTWTFVRQNHQFELRREVTGPKGTLVTVTGHGKPMSRHSSGWTHQTPAVISTTSVPLVFPALLLSEEIAKPHLVLQPAKTDATAVVVKDFTSYLSSATMTRTWRFDTQTHLPRSVAYYVPSPVNELQHISEEINYGDFVAKDGIRFPGSFQVYLEGRLIETVTVSGIQLNPQHDSSYFDGK